ncbi:DUF799 domain-containing protein [Asaia spathodeae]|uniref:DUF799 domain-containing protein n=1 Tax=Asaia spathodeae TaxID=657016 RepID=A0ABX2P742_9PROT|nr:DUF799 domain-containing protein [Asaia spathodeae]GBR12554.1 hypothetical protein AA105894_0556 [Asaia spathodeae NBRC 105894]
MKSAVSMRRLAGLALCLAVTACATPLKAPDYTAFRAAKPRTILVLPPVNHTPDTKATNGLLSQMTMPLAEGGYYVVPVTLETETFRQNGLSAPDEIIQAPAEKLRTIFGADAALYTTITAYGSVYHVIDSNTVVTASSKLVDLRSGSVLWTGTGSATGADVGEMTGGGSIMGMLIVAAVKQVSNNLMDHSFPVAAVAADRLLKVGPPDGLLYGPRSVKYGTD